MSDTSTEHVTISDLFIEWKKKVSENAKMKIFMKNFVNIKAENLTPKEAKNILRFSQENARKVLKEIKETERN